MSVVLEGLFQAGKLGQELVTLIHALLFGG
jgi:hypothetical protein